MTSGEPDVSVVIPTHNRSKFLSTAIESALSAIGELDGEVVVVDDGSTDATPKVLSRVEDPRVRSFRQHQSGAPAARNRGVELARGRYIKFLDDDDLLEPGALKVEYQSALEAGADLVAGTIISEVVRKGETVTRRRHPPPPGSDPFVGLMSREYTPQPLRFFCRRAFVIDQPWQEGLGLAQDLEYFLRVAGHARGYVNVPDVVGYHRRHEGQRISDRHRGRRGVTTRLRLMIELAGMLENGVIPSTRERRKAACHGVWNELHHAAAYGWTEDCERAWRIIERLSPDGSYFPRRHRRAFAILDRVLGPRNVERLLVPPRSLKRYVQKLLHTGEQD